MLLDIILKMSGAAILLVCLFFVMAESTRIKIPLQDRYSTMASSMTFDKGCDDKIEQNKVPKQLEKLKQRRAEVKFFKSDNAAEKLEADLNRILPGTTTTAGAFLAKLREKKCPTYIFGGAVRDALLGVDSKDIDAETDCKPSKVAAICKEAFKNKNLCHQHHPQSRLVNFGSKDHIDKAVDMAPNTDTFYGSKKHLEYTPNSLAYDYGGANVVIGLTGTAVDDTCNMTIRIPVEEKDWKAWATIRKNDHGKKIFRYWKLKSKGFEPIDDNKTDAFLIKEAKEHINNNKGKYPRWLKMKKYFCSIMYGHNNFVKYYYDHRNRRTEGCDIEKKDCKKYKNGKAKKASDFKKIIFQDLKWTLPTCGE